MTKSEALNILGLSGNPSEEEIKKAYRKLAVTNHPDKHKGSKEFEEKFKNIQSAYDYLTNPQSQNNEFVRENFFEEMDQMFSAAFGFNNKQRRTEVHKPQENPCDKKIQLPDVNIGEYVITLNQLLFKEEIDLKLKVQTCCRDCLSNKQIWSQCTACNGIGKVNHHLRTPIGILNQISQCRQCGGLGWNKNNHCIICKDKLIHLKDKTINFKIPNNFILGSNIKVTEKGNEGWNVLHSSIFVEPIIKMPSLDTLTEEEKNLLKTLLNK